MKKFNVKKPFKGGSFKHRARSTAVTAIFLVAIIAINIAAAKLDIKKDLTQDKLYTLTEETINILKNLKNDIKIFMFFETGKNDPYISAIIDKYKSASNKLTIEERDPIKQPQLAQKYSKEDKNVGIGSIVVECGNKFKTIIYDDFFNYSFGEYGEENIDSFAAEQQITNAIVYVNSEQEQVLYTLSGHGEGPLSSDVIKQLEVENYSVKELNFLQNNTELNEEDILIITSPKTDISNEEADKIRTFLKSGGRAAFFIDIAKQIFPNLQELLGYYGIRLQNAVVVEGQAGRIAQSQLELLPEIQSHEIVNAIKAKKMLIFMPVAQSIEEQKSKRDTVKIEPLLITSSNSWAKVNLNSNTLTKEAADLTGPFNIAAAITEKVDSKTAKLMVVGSSTFMNSNIISATNGANLDFVMNSLNWLQDKKDGISVRPKSLKVENLTMTNLQRLTLSAIVVILIPSAIIVAGIMVWLRRRHR